MNLYTASRPILILCILICNLGGISLSAQTPPLTRIATGLQNPRGVAVLPDGRLIVTQSGTGFSTGDPADDSGKLSILEDINGDGDYDDNGEITTILDHLPSYNILYQFNPGRDEVVGVGDVIALDDGRIFFTQDDHFKTLAIVEVDANLEQTGNLLERPGSMNSIAYDKQLDQIYVTESTRNAIGVATLDGEFRTLVTFPLLAHGQQAVPSGITIDPTTGDLLVALFSGQLWVYYGETLSFIPGDAKIVRLNPETGDYTDEITGLTTAVDVAVDEVGNIYVAELTTRWATTLLNQEFDLFDPDSPPDAGGYARYSGRVTIYPSDGSHKRLLAEDLDQPTNLTYHDGFLYISVGQGTPNRRIWGKDGVTQITGEIYKIDLHS